MARTKKAVSVVITLFAILFLQLILPPTIWGADWFEPYHEWRVEWPDSGTYYCSELDAFLHFDLAGNYFSYRDTQKITMHVGYDTAFHAFDGSEEIFCAGYFWNQRRDELKLTSVTFLGEDFGRKTYTFLRYDEDS